MDYNKILQLRTTPFLLIIWHDTHPKDVNENYEYPNNINNIDTNKNSDIRNNDSLCNDVNNSDTNYNNLNNKGIDNYDVNNIDIKKILIMSS